MLNLKFILLIPIISIGFVASQTLVSSSSAVQAAFNNLFINYVKSKTWYNVTQPFEAKPSVNKCKLTAKGESTNTAKDIHDLSIYTINYVSKLIPLQNTTNFTLVSIPAGYCPFTSQSYSCDANNKFRSLDGSCNNLKNPLYGKVLNNCHLLI